MSNNDIIKELQYADNNAEAVKKYLPSWNKAEAFPKDCLETCIKMHTWTYEDFSFKMERLITEYLPAFMLRVFFDMKEFRSNSRNELTSTCTALSKVQGYPMKTQDDKAFCQFKYSFSKYFNLNPIAN